MSALAWIAANPASARKRRLVVLQTHAIQYYAPLYRELARRGVLDVHVVYLTDAGAKPHFDAQFGIEVAWDIPLLEGYQFTVLQPGSEIAGRGFLQLDDPQLESVLRRLSPDWILVYGYSGRFIWRALTWARRHHVRVAYTSDSNFRDQRRNPLRLFAKQPVLRPFFHRVDACLATSEANQAYLEYFGAAPARIHRVPFAIDVRRFQAGALAAGQPREYDFIWAGKLNDNKRAEDFLAALARISRSLSPRPISAAVVGDGELRSRLESQAAGLPENCKVAFPGFVNQSAMPATLQRANVFVFTSRREPYGLGATEAAAAGLALIVADNIGCVGATVLAQPGVNARTYRSGDVSGLAEQMLWILEHPDELRHMQVASRRIAVAHDLPAAAAVIGNVMSMEAAA